MRIKELSIVFALAIFGAIIIISVQENNQLTAKDMKTFENYESVGIICNKNNVNFEEIIGMDCNNWCRNRFFLSIWLSS